MIRMILFVPMGLLLFVAAGAPAQAQTLKKVKVTPDQVAAGGAVPDETAVWMLFLLLEYRPGARSDEVPVAHLKGSVLTAGEQAALMRLALRTTDLVKEMEKAVLSQPVDLEAKTALLRSSRARIIREAIIHLHQRMHVDPVRFQMFLDQDVKPNVSLAPGQTTYSSLMEAHRCTRQE